MTLVRVLTALVPVIAFGHALSYSWGRWGEIAIDWGRELQVAHDVAAGGRLYADLHYWYGPVAPYTDALLFRLFGVRAGVLTCAGLGSAALMTALLWALARRSTGDLGAAMVATAFVYLCAFGHYYLNDIFNWATPYAYAATYGMLLAVASLYALLRHIDGGHLAWLATSLACLALTMLAKLEPTLPALMAHAAFLVGLWASGRRGIGRLLAGYGIVAAAVAGVVAGFTFQAGVGAYRTSVLSQVNVRNAGPVLRYMGVADWPAAISAMSGSALRLAVCLLLPIAAARATRAVVFGRWAAAAVSAIVPLLVLGTGDPLRVLRALPIFVAAGIVLAAVDFARQRTEPSAPLAALVLWAFALGSLARVPLAAGAYHYGFYLLPVPLAAVLLVWFADLPARLTGLPAARWCATWAGVAVVLGLCWTHARASAAMWRLHTAQVRTPRGELRLLDDAGGMRVGELYAAVIGRLRDYPPGATVMAAPDGAGLAFMAGLGTWHGHYSYNPPEVGPGADVQLRAELEADPPDLVVLLNLLDLSHYGFAGFGRDYARASVGWILQRYEVDRIYPGDTVVIARPRGSVPLQR